MVSCQQVMGLTGLILAAFFQPEGPRVSPSYHQPAVTNKKQHGSLEDCLVSAIVDTNYDVCVRSGIFMTSAY